MTDKKLEYDLATKKLVEQAKNLSLPAEFSTKYDLVDTVKVFREAFKNPILRKQVLSQKYEKERVKQYRFSAGFCGIASYTWNHLFRMPDMSEIWRLKQFSKNNIVTGLTNHVWLENKFDGSILDLSFDQSVDKNGSFIEIPYHLGNYVNSNFEFQRAYKFAKHIGIDLEYTVFINRLFSNSRNNSN